MLDMLGVLHAFMRAHRLFSPEASYDHLADRLLLRKDNVAMTAGPRCEPVALSQARGCAVL
jgi:hypothetical protein